jgi:hypothetical protein
VPPGQEAKASRSTGDAIEETPRFGRESVECSRHAFGWTRRIGAELRQGGFDSTPLVLESRRGAFDFSSRIVQAARRFACGVVHAVGSVIDVIGDRLRGVFDGFGVVSEGS